MATTRVKEKEAASAVPRWTVRVVPGDEYLGVVEGRRKEAAEKARQMAEERDCVVGLWKGASRKAPRRKDGTRIRPTVRIDRWFPNAAPAKEPEAAAEANGKR